VSWASSAPPPRPNQTFANSGTRRAAVHELDARPISSHGLMELTNDLRQLLSAGVRAAAPECLSQGGAGGIAREPLLDIPQRAAAGGGGDRERGRGRDGAWGIGIPQGHVEKRLLALDAQVQGALGHSQCLGHVCHLRRAIPVGDPTYRLWLSIISVVPS
jgi:hypothetical protein